MGPGDVGSVLGVLSSVPVVRTQVSLTDEQMAGLRRLAQAHQVSLAAALRDAVDHALEREDRRAGRVRALQAIATISQEGPPDLAEAHDRHLDHPTG